MKPAIQFLKIAGFLMGSALAAEEPLARPYEAAEFAVAQGKTDDLVFAAARKAGIGLARPCSDEVFLRRVYLDVIGMLPEAGRGAGFPEGHPLGQARGVDRCTAGPR